MSQPGGAGQGGRPPPTGPPYPPQTWALGGRLEESIDIPITAVFLALFLGGAIGHMVTFKKNLKRGHKFILSVLIFAFCMCRVVTCILRISSSTRPTNVRLAIAAQIFVAAGVLLVYIVNLIFAQRLIRAQHPRLGWSFRFGLFFKLTYVVVAFTLIMVITVTVQSFYTLSINTRRIDRDIQLYCGTFFAYVSFLPIPLTLIGLILPRKKRLEKFGLGRWRTKVFVLLLGSFTLCLGAAFKCATAYLEPVPLSQPLPSYYSRACFYVFNFTLEILVVYFYLIARIDRRFHIPNGAKGPGQYARGPYAPKTVDTKRTSVQSKKHDSMQSGLDRASTLNEYDGATTPRTLNLKTDFSTSEKRKLDLEAQTEPPSAISGTTAALSKDHLLLPESPKPVHIKSEKHKFNTDVPPVPALPPSATGALPSPTPANIPLPSSGAASMRTAEDKLDKVVDLLVALDRRLSYLEEAPRREPSSFDLLERLNARLSRLEEGDPAATPRMRPQSSAGTTLRGSVDNAGVNMGFGGISDNPAVNLLDRLDRRLSRLEEHEAAARMSRQNSGNIDTLMMLDRRLSAMESRIASPDPARFSGSTARGSYQHPPMASPPDFDAVFGSEPLPPPAENRFDRWNYSGTSSPRLRGGGSMNTSPHRPAMVNHQRFSQSPSRFQNSARAGPVADTWPLDEQAEEQQQHTNPYQQQQQQQQQQQHPAQLRPGFVRAPPSNDSMGTVTLNAQDNDDDHDMNNHYASALDVGRAYTPDDDRPHRLDDDDADDEEEHEVRNARLAAPSSGLAYSVSVSSQYSRATEEGGTLSGERPRTAYVVEDGQQLPVLSPEAEEFHSARGSTGGGSQ